MQVEHARDGCVRNTGSRKGGRFVCVPIGIRPGGLQLEARHALRITAHDPLTGEAVTTAAMKPGDRVTLPQQAGAVIITGRVPAADAEDDDAADGRASTAADSTLLMPLK